MKYLKTYEQNNEIPFQEWLKRNPQDINTTKINCSESNLIDLNGIEKFKNLEKLYCYNNQLTELPDLSQLINLEDLGCYNNQLTELPDISKNLKILYCSYNRLTELPDLSQCKNLKRLECYNNLLPYNDLKEYMVWHKKTYPWIYTAKKYNL